MPRLSIIIPTYQEEQYIERTLKHLAALDIPHEIVVTDGGSTDKTLPIARQYTDNVVVWDRPKMGRRQTIGEARNLGAKVATGEFFVFIDADVIIPEPTDFFEKALARFAENPKLVAATAPLVPLAENHSIIDHIGCAPLNLFYIFSNNVMHNPNASGEFQMMRADAFRKVGGFPEHLVNGEDNEMFRQLGKLGQTRSFGDLPVTHSLRRPHTWGWGKTYWVWIKNGLTVAWYKKSTLKEWEVVR